MGFDPHSIYWEEEFHIFDLGGTFVKIHAILNDTKLILVLVPLC